MTKSDMQHQLDTVGQRVETVVQTVDTLGGRLDGVAHEAGVTALLNKLLAQKQVEVVHSIYPSASTSNISNRLPRDQGTVDVFEGSTPHQQPLHQGGPAFHGGLATRIGRVEFPKFNGSDLREWICTCEQFSTLDSTAADRKVALASLHLEGKAL